MADLYGNPSDPFPFRRDQVLDLVNRWEQLVGYNVEIPEWAIKEMANTRSVSTLYDIGQYMAAHSDKIGADPAYFIHFDMDAVPWAKWGMSNVLYSQSLEGFDTAFRAATGQAAPPDIIERALREHQGKMTQGQFSTWLHTQDSIKQQYGWLRYGLDFNQFQTQKLSMRAGFGRDLTDAEAVTQLQYHHAAQGGNVGVSTQPTLSQAEKKQTQTGVSGNVVR